MLIDKKYIVILILSIGALLWIMNIRASKYKEAANIAKYNLRVLSSEMTVIKNKKGGTTTVMPVTNMTANELKRQNPGLYDEIQALKKDGIKTKVVAQTKVVTKIDTIWATKTDTLHVTQDIKKNSSVVLPQLKSPPDSVFSFNTQTKFNAEISDSGHLSISDVATVVTDLNVTVPLIMGLHENGTDFFIKSKDDRVSIDTLFGNAILKNQRRTSFGGVTIGPSIVYNIHDKTFDLGIGVTYGISVNRKRRKF